MENPKSSPFKGGHDSLTCRPDSFYGLVMGLDDPANRRFPCLTLSTFPT